jgi:hypothetical protein
MQLSKIFFRAASEIDYELTAEHEEGRYTPTFLSERTDGTIVDLTGECTWPSLIDMSQDLEIEITSWGSEVGD